MAEEQATMVLVCTCGQKMKVPADAMGKTFKCVRCAQKVRVSADNSHGAMIPAEDAPPQAAPPERIGQMLIEEGLISQEQLEQALGLQCERGGKTFDILIELGHLDKEALHAFLSRQSGVATIDLSRFSIDRDLIRLIPRSMALEQSVLPIDRLGKLLTVAMACPIDTSTIAEMEAMTQLKVKAVLCKLDDLRAVVAKYYRDPNEPLDPSGGFALYGGAPSRIRFDPSDAIATLAALPISPDAARAASTAAAEGPEGLAALLDAVASDPPLAATVLRAANSAAYGLRGSVGDLALAVALLGPRAIAGLLEGAAAPAAGNEALQPQRAHAQAVARLAAALAQISGAVSRGEALCAGILANLGVFVLAAAAPDKFRFLDLSQGPEALREAEAKIFTLSSAEAGAKLLADWGCPETLQNVVRTVGLPAGNGDFEPLAVLVAAACRMAEAGPGADEACLAPLESALARLGLVPAAALEALRTLPNE